MLLNSIIVMFGKSSYIKVFLFFLLFLNGCRYKWGVPIAEEIKTIYVAPAKNDAFVSQAQSVLTNKIRERFLKDGFLEIAEKDAADVILETVISGYGRSLGSVVEEDPDRAKTISLSLTVKITLKNSNTGNFYFKDRAFTSSLSVEASGMSQSIEYQSMPYLSEKLSGEIVAFVYNVKSSQDFMSDKQDLVHAR